VSFPEAVFLCSSSLPTNSITARKEMTTFDVGFGYNVIIKFTLISRLTDEYLYCVSVSDL
jgi:hypothetical protein